jgi:hypothetical protein
MSSSKKIARLAVGVYLSDAQNPITTTPTHTIRVSVQYLFTQRRWGGGRVEPERRERVNRGEYRSERWLNVGKKMAISSL